MNDLPSDTLALYDTDGQLFGHVRIAPNESRADRIDCIFDCPQPIESADPAARWLAKRHYVRWSEHRLVPGQSGEITIKKANFQVTFEPREEGGLQSRPPQPTVFADWEL